MTYNSEEQNSPGPKNQFVERTQINYLTVNLNDHP